MNFSENREIWNELTNIIQSYLDENKDSATPVVNYEPAVKLKEILDLKLTDNGEDMQSLLQEVKNFLKYSPRTTHPQFNNQLSAGANFESLMGEVVSFLANATMSTYEVSPAATLIENKLVEELNAKIGFNNGGGIMVTGGSNANMLALHCARNKMLEHVKARGNQGKNLRIYVSCEAHYSFAKAVILMGIGYENLIEIKSDKYGRMITSELEDHIKNDLSNGHMPLCIVSTAGTTVKGAFDPIAANQEIANKYQLWHHVDGAWGGMALFSDKINDKIKDVKNADSFTFDAHKLLGTGLITSFFMTKEKDAIRSANSNDGGEYLFHHYENAEYDTGKASLQCGRKVDALKLWLTWKSLGHKGLTKLVDDQLTKADFFINYLKESKRYHLVYEPEYLNVCFQVYPTDDKDVNAHNIEARFKLVKSGKYLVNYSTDTTGNKFFRMVFANTHTTIDDLKTLLASIEEA